MFVVWFSSYGLNQALRCIWFKPWSRWIQLYSNPTVHTLCFFSDVTHEAEKLLVLIKHTSANEEPTLTQFRYTDSQFYLQTVSHPLINKSVSQTSASWPRAAAAAAPSLTRRHVNLRVNNKHVWDMKTVELKQSLKSVTTTRGTKPDSQLHVKQILGTRLQWSSVGSVGLVLDVCSLSSAQWMMSVV